MSPSNKAKIARSAKRHIQPAIEELKSEFRRWYGEISIDELMENKELISEIKSLEQMLASSEE